MMNILKLKLNNQNELAKKKLPMIFLTILLVLIGLVLVILCAIPPVMMNKTVNLHVNFEKTYQAAEFGLVAQKLTLKTSDGIKIVAHEVYTPQPKAVVIIISGIHRPSVTEFFGQAKMLQEHGYASILYEMRAHGESEGNLICLGYKEYLDTQAVVKYIKSSQKYQQIPIVVYGTSMGGATAINSIGEIPEIDGLVSMSAYASLEDVFYDNMIGMGLPRFYCELQKIFVKPYIAYKYGIKALAISPKQGIKKLGNRPALLMHSQGDLEVPVVNLQRIMANAARQVETWVRAGNLHFIVKNEHFLDPQQDQEFVKHVIGFLDAHYAINKK